MPDYNTDISKGATIGADDAQETFSSISVKKMNEK